MQMTSTIGRVHAAQLCASWADAGIADDYVVYEGVDGWVFAGGVRARIELTASTLTISGDDVPAASTEPWSGTPARALANALDALPYADWRVYGWIGFDFCAPFLDAAERLDGTEQLAVLIVPEFEVFVDAAGSFQVVGGDAPGTDASGVEASEEAEKLLARLNEVAARPLEGIDLMPRGLDVDVDTHDYRSRVATAINEIRSGAYEKVIVSRRVDVPFAVDIPATYARGRMDNNPARSFLLRLGGVEAAGFSPELVGAVNADGLVTTEPLAGTRAFGRSEELDLAAREELINDSKEIVEHAISVRLSCAEVDEVAIAGTTAVTEFMTVKERGSVQHLASTVTGQLADHNGPWDALQVLFPSVTASGIPKRPAVDAIYRLEDSRRELYSGAVVTASSAGELEATLVLRSVFTTDGGSWLRAGAGVVADSNPEREFIETCEKLGSVAPYLVEKR